MASKKCLREDRDRTKREKFITAARRKRFQAIARKQHGSSGDMPVVRE